MREQHLQKRMFRQTEEEYLSFSARAAKLWHSSPTSFVYSSSIMQACPTCRGWRMLLIVVICRHPGSGCSDRRHMHAKGFKLLRQGSCSAKSLAKSCKANRCRISQHRARRVELKRPVFLHKPPSSSLEFGCIPALYAVCTEGLGVIGLALSLLGKDLSSSHTSAPQDLAPVIGLQEYVGHPVFARKAINFLRIRREAFFERPR